MRRDLALQLLFPGGLLFSVRVLESITHRTRLSTATPARNISTGLHYLWAAILTSTFQQGTRKDGFDDLQQPVPLDSYVSLLNAQRRCPLQASFYGV
jgi:hypothetical protein